MENLPSRGTAGLRGRMSSRWVRRLGLAATLLVASLTLSDWARPRPLELSAPDPSPTQLFIEPSLLAKLQTLAGGLHAEIALCLLGKIDGDMARLSDFFMPEPTVSTSSRSLVRPCPREALAVWHNHPLEGADVSGAREGAGTAAAARRLCVLSKTDIQTSLRFDHPFVVVAVDRHTWCWWTRAEVARFAATEGWPGVPMPARLATRGDPLPRSSGGPLARQEGSAGFPHSLGSPR